MAYCTNCGTQVPDSARFCINCGQSASGPSTGGSTGTSFLPGTPITPVVAEPLKYDIEGHNLQIARVHLKPGQEIYAEAGKMVYKTANIDWATRMTGQNWTDKIIGVLKRKLMGESVFFTYFQATATEGHLGFAGHYPGKIQVFDLAPGQTIMVQRDGFLFAQSTVTLDIALVRRLGAGLLGLL